jgi:hypothetical protein
MKSTQYYSVVLKDPGLEPQQMFISARKWKSSEDLTRLQSVSGPFRATWVADFCKRYPETKVVE